MQQQYWKYAAPYWSLLPIESFPFLQLCSFWRNLFWQNLVFKQKFSISIYFSSCHSTHCHFSLSLSSRHPIISFGCCCSKKKQKPVILLPKYEIPFIHHAHLHLHLTNDAFLFLYVHNTLMQFQWNSIKILLQWVYESWFSFQIASKALFLGLDGNISKMHWGKDIEHLLQTQSPVPWNFQYLSVSSESPFPVCVFSFPWSWLASLARHYYLPLLLARREEGIYFAIKYCCYKEHAHTLIILQIACPWSFV